jgi:hypothetical protein
MSIKQVHDALEARAVTAITAVSATLPIEYENVAFAPPDAGKYASLAQAFKVSSEEEHALGPAGTKLVRGIYSINVVYPTNIGDDGTRTDLETLKGYFPLAQTASSSGQTVTVRGSFPPNTRTVGTTYRATFSIEWEAIVPK